MNIFILQMNKYSNTFGMYDYARDYVWIELFLRITIYFLLI